MRLIDADDFKNRMYHEVFEKDTDMQKWDSGCWMRYKLFENVLKEQPTIEPERAGKWIYEPAYDWHRCGACKKVYSNVLMEHFNECQYQPRFNYCPNCGARMEP